jgi:hypothetical protein
MSIANAENIKTGTYRHYKGNEYEIIGLAKNSETLEEFVVYRALYGDYQLWIRPKAMFFETVQKDGKEIHRFEYLDSKNRFLHFLSARVRTFLRSR